MVSFTKCKWGTLIPLLPTRKPSKMPLFFALNISLKTLATIIKKKGENGSPCLSPLVTLTHPLALPFPKITKLVEDKQPLIHDIHLVLNLFLYRA